MQHTKHALQRHNGPVGWLILAGVLWILASGIVHNQNTVDHEPDKVEQRR